VKDFFGRELLLGDTVAVEAPGYRMLIAGTITAFTNKMMRIEYVNTWNYRDPGVTETFLARPDQVVRKFVEG
jgi:hypothetical protein